MELTKGGSDFDALLVHFCSLRAEQRAGSAGQGGVISGHHLSASESAETVHVD